MPIKNMLTVTEAATELGVSRQRMHVLIKTYDLKTQPAGPIKMIDRKEIKKIPEIRPTGKKLSQKAG